MVTTTDSARKMIPKILASVLSNRFTGISVRVGMRARLPDDSRRAVVRRQAISDHAIT
jgi:hypothetical protein